MLNNDYLDSLLGKLTENIVSLESSYVNFSDKCSIPTETNISVYNQLSQQYEEIKNSIIQLKHSHITEASPRTSLNHTPQLITSECKSFSKSSTFLDSIQNSNSCSRLNTSPRVDSQYDNLLKMITKHRCESLNCLRTLESENFKLKNSGGNEKISIMKRDQLTQTIVQGCSECGKIRENTKSIVTKMTNLVDEINYQVKEIPNYTMNEKVVHFIDSPRSPGTFFDNNSLASLSRELNSLKEKNRDLEEKLVASMKIKAKNEALQSALDGKERKMKRLEDSISENEELIERLKQTIDNQAIEERKTFNSMSHLKIHLENKIKDMEAKIRQLEHERTLRLQKDSEILNKSQILENENQELFANYSFLKESFEKTNTSLRESESKLQNLQRNAIYTEKYKATIKTQEEELETIKVAFNKNTKELAEKNKENIKLKESYELIVKALKENTKKFEELYKIHESMKQERQLRLNSLSIENINLKDSITSTRTNLSSKTENKILENLKTVERRYQESLEENETLKKMHNEISNEVTRNQEKLNSA